MKLSVAASIVLSTAIPSFAFVAMPGRGVATTTKFAGCGSAPPAARPLMMSEVVDAETVEAPAGETFE